MSERTFEFKDGTSNKFWAISVSGDSHTVRFGKIGTSGQSKTKKFASAAVATADAGKLIAEKTGKGYLETTTGATASTPAAAPTAAAAPAVKKASAPKAKPAPTPEVEEAEDPTPIVVSAPNAKARPEIDLSPEDYLWVTYGDRPAYTPTKPLKFTTKQFLEKLSNPDKHFREKTDWRDLTGWLRDLLPTIAQLTDAERAQAQKILAPQVTVADWPDDYDAPSAAFFVAAALGMHAEMEALVSSWPDDAFSSAMPHHLYYSLPLYILCGLASRERVLFHRNRLKLRFSRPDELRTWLALTGTDALDLIRDAVVKPTSKDEVEKLLREFTRVNSPLAAPYMLELLTESKSPAQARSWLIEDPVRSADGLAILATGRGKLADAAKEFLHELKLKGHTDALEKASAAHPEAAATIRGILDTVTKTYPPLTREGMPQALRTALEALPKKLPSLPDWISPATLPPLLFNGSRLSDADTTAFLADCRSQKGDARPTLAEIVKKHGDARALDAFAWAVFTEWGRASYLTKEKWCLLLVGWIGGDSCARQLTPLVRDWPGQSQHPRAKLGLEVLRMIGTDIALTLLNGIAQKLKFPGLKARARELMDLIATDRGMTRAELEDRIVPDLDLDEKGERIFDYGPRQFRLVIGSDYKPRAKGPDDKVKDSLPAPNSKDDAEKAKIAKADWSAFTKTLRGVLDLQRARLEQAMVTMRRWSVADFEAFLVNHPVMTHLTRRLVWGQFSTPTKLAKSFRVTEEREYADAADKPVSLDPKLQIGIIHPMHLTDAERNSWGQVFGDYEIVAPFEQLSRPVYTLEGKEASENTLHRIDDIGINSGKVWGFTDKRGWERGSSSDHGVVTEFVKWYPSADVTAVFDIDPGIARGGLDLLSAEQKITGCYFLKGHYNPIAYVHHRDDKKMKLGTVDPVALSETLGDLYRLSSKE